MSVYEHDSYLSYLESKLDTQGENRGLRSRLAEVLKCQSSYISQILNGKANLSLEQAILISDFFGHDGYETKYFLTLVQISRAGNEELKKFFSRELEALRKKRSPISSRLKIADKITGETQAIYYSHWWYSAIHILTAFPEFGTADAISKRLSLPLSVVKEALKFLKSTGLVDVEASGLFKIGKARIHVSVDSPMYTRHHANWRWQSLAAMERPGKEDLRFTGVVGLSRKDFAAIKKLALEYIEKSDSILKKSKEESMFITLLDLYEI